MSDNALLLCVCRPVSEAIFSIIMFLGVTLGWIPVLTLCLINNKPTAAHSNVMQTVYNVTAAAAVGGGGGNNLNAGAMIIGGSVWCFIVGCGCLAFGTCSSLSLRARPSFFTLIFFSKLSYLLQT
jgi:hypothetical protein